MSSPEPEPNPTPEEVAHAVFVFAAQLMAKGMHDADIKSQLIEKGLDEESAILVIRKLHEARDHVLKEAGRKNMLFGALWCIGGTLVTLITYSAASANPGGGSYVVAWGAIIFGAVQFFRGLSQTAGDSAHST